VTDYLSISSQYALAIGDGVVKDEVIARCDAHAAFLLDQFPQEGDFEWADTSFFKWMQSRHTVSGDLTFTTLCRASWIVRTDIGIGSSSPDRWENNTEARAGTRRCF